MGSRNNPSRRDFLTGAAALLAGPAIGTASLGAARTAAAADGPAGLIVREREPLNLEFPFSTLNGPVLANDQFYVRNHFPAPAIRPQEWRLRVEGAVDRPLELTYDDLLRMPAVTTSALLECAGNNRSYLGPEVKGVAWQLGAVGVARWTGVPLALVLDRARVRSGAVEVILEGADRGTVANFPEEIRFARSLPLKKARRGDVLLAHHMNNAELPKDHGFPLRAVVPGWYGVASVKWLTRIIVSEQPFHGYFQSVDYTVWQRPNGLPTQVPITEMLLKAQIARPTLGEKLTAGKEYRIFGAAWTGNGEVARVEVSTDGGDRWTEARLLGKANPYTWRLWEYDWQVPGRTGPRVVLARAVDSEGRKQPLEREKDRRNYLINHVLPIRVDVV